MQLDAVKWKEITLHRKTVSHEEDIRTFLSGGKCDTSVLPFANRQAKMRDDEVGVRGARKSISSRIHRGGRLGTMELTFPTSSMRTWRIKQRDVGLRSSLSRRVLKYWRRTETTSVEPKPAKDADPQIAPYEGSLRQRVDVLDKTGI